MRFQVLIIAVSIAVGSVGAPSTLPAAASQNASDHSSKRMPDGKQWMTENLKIAVDPSYCYDGSDENCRYGRLYTWESAQRACRALGDGWRLPTNDEWAQVAKSYGGVRDDSADGGKAAYVALLAGGPSGSMPSMAAAEIRVVNTRAWKPTDSTGRRRKAARRRRGSTISARTVRFSIVTKMGRSRGHSPCGV